MASEIDEWPDNKIRQKFEEFGISSPPVTGTTRKFLIKKLKNLMTDGGATPKKQVEEEEPYDDEPDVPPLPPTRIPRRLGRSALASLNDASHNSAIHESPSLSPVKRNTSPGRSPSRVVTSTTTQDSGKSTRSKSPSRVPSAYTPSPDENERPARKVTPGRRAPEREPDPIFTSRPLPNVYASSPSSNADLFQPRKSLERNYDLGNDTFRSRLIDSSAGNFESDFMRRVTGGTPHETKRYVNDEDAMLSDDEVDVRDPLQVISSSKPVGYEISSSKKGRAFPIALYFAFLVPFTILVGSFALFYNSSQSAVTKHEYVFPVCRGSSVDVPGVTCVEEIDRHHVEAMFTAFVTGVTDIKNRAPCTTSHAQPIFIDNQFVKDMIVTNDEKISLWQAEQKLPQMKVLVDSNQYLNLKSKSDGIQIIRGPETFLCSIWNKVVLLAEWIITIGVTTILAYSFYFAVQWHLAKQQKFDEDVMSAFDKLVDMTKTRKFINVKQAGDELVSGGFSVDVINEVLKKATSDLRFHLHERNDVKGFLWAGEGGAGEKPGKFILTGGEAVGHFVAPSSCLKIRGMFDPTKKIMNNEEIKRIVDAILEESIGNMLIHVAVDPHSHEGVVYARGLLSADAAGVFRRINGSIFDGRRVTVKFVRDARYDEKFPGSAAFTRPLRPSTRTY